MLICLQETDRYKCPQRSKIKAPWTQTTNLLAKRYALLSRVSIFGMRWPTFKQQLFGGVAIFRNEMGVAQKGWSLLICYSFLHKIEQYWISICCTWSFSEIALSIDVKLLYIISSLDVAAWRCGQANMRTCEHVEMLGSIEPLKLLMGAGSLGPQLL